MRIVLLCGNQPNQIALAAKLAARYQLAGVVFESKKQLSVKQLSFTALVNKALDVTVFGFIRNTWKRLMQYYSNYTIPQGVVQKTVANINTPEAVEFINELKPDMLLVSGTSLVKKGILELPIPHGILNLHTGLSPYIKGGPNCTNWCVATGQSHLIGNTIMWIDAGIDSGDIVATDLTPLTGNETYFELHRKVMDHAHQLYVDAVDYVVQQHPRAKQADIAKGTTYYTRMWNNSAKLKLALRFIFNYKSEIKAQQQKLAEQQIKYYPIKS
jgi:methionyl-tRNA formyltransferase